jgi:hypothetical protein
MADTEVDFSVVGHIEEADSPCVGFFYSEGPADYIVGDSFWGVKIPKGQAATYVFPHWPVCTSMSFSGVHLVFPVEGTYRLDVFAGFMSDDTPVVEDGPYPVTINVSPFVPASVSVAKFNVPSKAYVGLPAGFNVEGHVDVGGGNPCVGLMYVDGPSPSINVRGNNVAKGQAFVSSYAYQDACFSLSLDGSIVFPSVGIYKLAVIGGYVDVLAKTINATARVDVNVGVAEATANISGKITELLFFGLVKRPSVGAKVSLDSLKFAYTGGDGAYSLADVPLGTYKVSVSKPFFEEKTSEISLTEAGKTYSLDLEIGISKWANYGLATGMVAIPLLALTALAKKPTKKW